MACVQNGENIYTEHPSPPPLLAVFITYAISKTTFTTHTQRMYSGSVGGWPVLFSMWLDRQWCMCCVVQVIHCVNVVAYLLLQRNLELQTFLKLSLTQCEYMIYCTMFINIFMC